MKKFCILLKNEWRLALLSPSSYLAGFLFLVVMGFFFIFILEEYRQGPQMEPALVRFFQTFWVPVLFVVPALTMRSFAEPRRSGTLDTLCTLPVSSFQIVLSKFCAAYTLYIVLWGLALCFPFVAYFSFPEVFNEPVFLDSAALIGGSAFISLTGLVFIAIGVFASALSSSQFIAAILTFTLIFLFLFAGRLLTELGYGLDRVIRFPNFFDPLSDFSHGILDSRPIVFFVSLASFFFVLTVNRLSRRD